MMRLLTEAKMLLTSEPLFVMLLVGGVAGWLAGVLMRAAVTE
jgi:hypothetical protein